MSGEPRAPPPPSSRMQALAAKSESLTEECIALHDRNAELLKENIRLRKKLDLAYDALTAAHIPIPPDPDEDPEEGGTRRRHRRHRRKRTSRT